MCSWVEGTHIDQMRIEFVFSKQIIENTMIVFCVGMNCAYAARFRKVVRGNYKMLYPLVETDIEGIPILSTPYLLNFHIQPKHLYVGSADYVLLCYYIN